MALNVWDLHYFVISIISILLLFALIFSLFLTFLRKRTVGTFLLINTFSGLFLNEVFTMTSFFVQAFATITPTVEKAIKILQVSGVFMLMYTVYWMYFFANRHLLRDNDIFKGFFTSSFGMIVGATMGISIYEILADIEPARLYFEIDFAGSILSLHYPSISGLYSIPLIIIFILSISAYIRIILRTYQLQRKARDVVTKKGLRVVTWSIILLLATGFILGVYLFGINEIAWLSALTYLFRGGIIIAAVVTGYLGWTMPEWLRKRFRGKTWIAKVYTGKIPEPTYKDGDPKTIELDTSKAIEVSEK